jgi:NAD(P)-dependent dehydrogenase (short-subunit alcohol dehydrogenase family)
MKLKDKVAIITGGAKGIGQGCARVFAKHGAVVVIADRDEKAGPAAAAEIVQKAGRASFQRCDVTKEEDIRSVIENTVRTHGRLDCLVSNAGWHPPAVTIEQITVADFEALLRLNLTSTFIGCKYALPHLRMTKGSIVIISSMTAKLGQAQASSYAASKAGQIGLTHALALDFAKDGVRINAVCPSAVMTPLMREWANTLENPEKALQIVERIQPLARMASIEEIGEVCAFLASDEASYMTGETVNVDGGARLGYGDKCGS